METPLRRQRKVCAVALVCTSSEKHLCVGREKALVFVVTYSTIETPLRRQRKVDAHPDSSTPQRNTSA